MKSEYKVLEAKIPFAESMIWDINRSYYHEAGLSAWSSGVVPHNMTSNAYVGKTYAAMIIGFLKDVARDIGNIGKVYIVELGAGHGRLGFHILQYLDEMISLEATLLPEYCYVLTDIVESNLLFFSEHHQLQPFFESGRCDVAYFDGVNSDKIELRKKNTTILKNDLSLPIIAIANYFFDSLPIDLYFIKDNRYTPCHITLESYLDLSTNSPAELLKSIKSTIDISTSENNDNLDSISNFILEKYKQILTETYLLLPRLSIHCIETLRQFSSKGMLLLTIDKGITELGELDGRPIPEIIRHGSFSLYVNFHSLGLYCDFIKGKSLFSASTDSSLQLGCMLLLDEPENFYETYKTYDQYVTSFGPDDYNGMKKMVYRLVGELTLKELIISLKLGYYDSNLFLQLLPFIKKKLGTLSNEDCKMLTKALTHIDKFYFDIEEPISTSYEIAGLYYDLGFYPEALKIYEKLSDDFGEKADIYYNRILCYYQLRMDEKFIDTLKEARSAFPLFEKFDHLDTIDLTAA